ncbi:hypothetical protein ACFV27_25555 [Streptomyces antimycoticus]|uniref:hypothetical protein n=1 Tax=Streptomyces antimycoticus TaxID=68175 RepID=UPI0036907D8B
MTHARTWRAMWRGRGRPHDSVTCPGEPSATRTVPTHPDNRPDTPPAQAAHPDSLFSQRTLLVLCAAATPAAIVGCIVALVSRQPLSVMFAAGYTFTAALGFFHQHTD